MRQDPVTLQHLECAYRLKGGVKSWRAGRGKEIGEDNAAITFSLLQIEHTREKFLRLSLQLSGKHRGLGTGQSSLSFGSENEKQHLSQRFVPSQK